MDLVRGGDPWTKGPCFVLSQSSVDIRLQRSSDDQLPVWVFKKFQFIGLPRSAGLFEWLCSHVRYLWSSMSLLQMEKTKRSYHHHGEMKPNQQSKRTHNCCRDCIISVDCTVDLQSCARISQNSIPVSQNNTQVSMFTVNGFSNCFICWFRFVSLVSAVSFQWFVRCFGFSVAHVVRLAAPE